MITYNTRYVLIKIDRNNLRITSIHGPFYSMHEVTKWGIAQHLVPENYIIHEMHKPI